MHCPNCGKETAADLRFCRTCGLNLEKIAELVAEQLPVKRDSDSVESGKEKWQPLAERVGLFILLSGAVIFFLSICWVIVTKIIIAKGEYVTGTIFLVILIALVLGGSLLGFSNSSSDSKKNPRVSSTPDPLPEVKSTDRLLAEPELEPVPSITERTTELLTVEEKRGAS
ncbi:MAG: hypothetical protein LC731_01015 [Acidobacteria bacterium]|nr:hypothetical protein [Acidobacteriota bacterium]